MGQEHSTLDQERIDIYEDDEEEDIHLNKYLSFHIGDKLYGIEIKNITDIIELQKITEVPDMPDYIKGVINLRGKIIPVMDMRLRLNKEEKEYDDRTCIININIDNVTVGLIVDTVSEVLRIPQEMIAKPPDFHSDETNNRFVNGIGKLEDENVVIILSEKHVLYAEDIKHVKQMSGEYK